MMAKDKEQALKKDAESAPSHREEAKSAPHDDKSATIVEKDKNRKRGSRRRKGRLVPTEAEQPKNTDSTSITKKTKERSEQHEVSIQSDITKQDQKNGDNVNKNGDIEKEVESQKSEAHDQQGDVAEDSNRSTTQVKTKKQFPEDAAETQLPRRSAVIQNIPVAVPQETLDAIARDMTVQSTHPESLHIATSAVQLPSGDNGLLVKKSRFDTIYGLTVTRGGKVYIEARRQHPLVFPAFEDIRQFRFAFGDQMLRVFNFYGGILADVDDSMDPQAATFFSRNSPTNHTTWGLDLFNLYYQAAAKQDHPLFRNAGVRSLLTNIMMTLPSASWLTEYNTIKRTGVAICAGWEFRLTLDIDALMREHLIMHDDMIMPGYPFYPADAYRWRELSYARFVDYANTLAPSWTIRYPNDSCYGSAFNPGRFAIVFTKMSNNHILMLDSFLSFREHFHDMYFPAIRDWCKLKNDDSVFVTTRSQLTNALGVSVTRASNASRIVSSLTSQMDLSTFAAQVMFTAAFGRWYRLSVREETMGDVVTLVNASLMPLVIPNHCVNMYTLFWRNSYILCNLLWVFRDHRNPGSDEQWTFAYWLAVREQLIGDQQVYDPIQHMLIHIQPDVRQAIYDYFCYDRGDGSGGSTGGATTYESGKYMAHRQFTASPGYEPLYKIDYAELKPASPTVQLQRLITFATLPFSRNIAQTNSGVVALNDIKVVMDCLRAVGRNMDLVNFFKYMDTCYRALAGTPMAYPLPSNFRMANEFMNINYVRMMEENVIVPLAKQNIAEIFKHNYQFKKDYRMLIEFKLNNLLTLCLSNFKDSIITQLPLSIIDSMWHMNHGFFMLGGMYIRYLISLFGHNPLLSPPMTNSGLGLTNSDAIKAALSDFKEISGVSDLYDIFSKSLRSIGETWYPPLDGCEFWVQVWQRIANEIFEHAGHMHLSTLHLVNYQSRNGFKGALTANGVYFWANIVYEPDPRVDRTYDVFEFNQGALSRDSMLAMTFHSMRREPFAVRCPFVFEVIDGGVDDGQIRIVQGDIQDVGDPPFLLLDPQHNARPFKIGVARLVKAYDDITAVAPINKYIPINYYLFDDVMMGELHAVLPTFINQYTYFSGVRFYKACIYDFANINPDSNLVSL